MTKAPNFSKPVGDAVAAAMRKTATSEGWGKPPGSALRHYIRAQEALCGLWGYFGDVTTDKASCEKCERCVAVYGHE